MGIYDSINQPVNPAAPRPNAMGQGFAQQQSQPQEQNLQSSYQKMQQRRANPMMQGRPAMNGAMNSLNSAMGSGSMRPNPMTGARPALSPAYGMGMPRPKPVMGNTPLAPAQGLAPSQLPANPSPGVPNLIPPGDVQVGVSDRMYRPPALADVEQMSQTDVMPRGLGPSVVMDENGLEPRRGPR